MAKEYSFKPATIDHMAKVYCWYRDNSTCHENALASAARAGAKMDWAVKRFHNLNDNRNNPGLLIENREAFFSELAQAIRYRGDPMELAVRVNFNP